MSVDATVTLFAFQNARAAVVAGTTREPRAFACSTYVHAYPSSMSMLPPSTPSPDPCLRYPDLTPENGSRGRGDDFDHHLTCLRSSSLAISSPRPPPVQLTPLPPDRPPSSHSNSRYPSHHAHHSIIKRRPRFPRRLFGRRPSLSFQSSVSHRLRPCAHTHPTHICHLPSAIGIGIGISASSQRENILTVILLSWHPPGPPLLSTSSSPSTPRPHLVLAIPARLKQLSTA
ncbi:hypothetical protein OF83DRAFT_586785 [Amylostereum chailletii]|nr:hypothetical protein OF83DRAFT_586785 [Amylostereum chailletii]